jgi:hypothetical protein
MRVASAALAFAYALAFFAVCLGTCLAATDEHACCEKPAGFTAASTSTDCCHVTAGVSSKMATSMAHVPTAAAWKPEVSATSFRVTRAVLPVEAAASPPLVLRI